MNEGQEEGLRVRVGVKIRYTDKSVLLNRLQYRLNISPLDILASGVLAKVTISLVIRF